MKKKLLLLLVGIILGGGLALGSAEMIERTSGVEFCASCHSMQGVAQAYKEDVHGGHNKWGVKAHCADCHLPHNNVLHYVKAKAISGVKDVIGEMFWAKKMNWVEHLKLREDFTYSTGCNKCHDLDAIHYEVPKAYLAHRDYKMGVVTSCVHCHQHVGHKNITDHLNKQQQ